MFNYIVANLLNFSFNSRQQQVENYLAKSHDLVELESRQRELARRGIWV